MYAVIRAGGKQYRVAPGDVVKVEKLGVAEGETVEFNDVLAVSGQEGQIGPGAGATVTGTVMEEGRKDKILVFHLKRKKQYKKMYGHRQSFSAVRITDIAFDGQTFSAPALPAKKKKAAPAEGSAKATGKAAAARRGRSTPKPAKKKKSSAKKKSAAKGKKR